jgi:hypothetical protein
LNSGRLVVERSGSSRCIEWVDADHRPILRDYDSLPDGCSHFVPAGTR